MKALHKSDLHKTTPVLHKSIPVTHSPITHSLPPYHGYHLNPRPNPYQDHQWSLSDPILTHTLWLDNSDSSLLSTIHTSLTHSPLPWWRILIRSLLIPFDCLLYTSLTHPPWPWLLITYWYADWSLMAQSSSYSFPLTLLTNPLWIPLTLPCRHTRLPVYKSAIWVPCSPSSDLVIILLSPITNTSWILPIHPYVRLPSKVPPVHSPLSHLKGPLHWAPLWQLGHSRRCLLVQPYPFISSLEPPSWKIDTHRSRSILTMT